MTIRHRAVQAEDKQERRDAIVAAARRLLEDDPDGVTSVADVADAAGLAKGTVYLYFPSKGALLLAVHEGALDAFFHDVEQLVSGARPPSVDEMLELTARHIVDASLFLPLATRCFGLMRHEVSVEVATAFGERMARRLGVIGGALEGHFPALAPGDGSALMRQSYALIIGLWQMAGSAAIGGVACVPNHGPTAAAGGRSFPDELRHALRALWRGTLEVEASATSVRAGS